MPPKFILIALGALIVGTFISNKTTALPLDKESNELSNLNSDEIEEFLKDSEDNDADDAMNEEEEEEDSDSEVVEYDEELEGEPDEKNEESDETKESEEENEEKQDDETKESEEENEVDKDDESEEEGKDEEDSEEPSSEEDDEEVKQDSEDTTDDNTKVKGEGKVRFDDSKEGDDYVRIVQVIDEDDSKKETKSASWYEKIKKYLATKFGLFGQKQKYY